MENQTKNTSFAEQTVDNKQYQTFNPKATLHLDVLPSEAGKTAVEPMKKTPASKPEESREKLLHGLLSNTGASAERTHLAQKKWQLVSLLTGILFVIAAVLVVWLALDISATGTQQGKLEAENQSLREQLNLAGSQITKLKTDMEALLNRNIELTTGNGKLNPQAVTSAAAASPKSASADSSRVEATKLKGATKAELIEAMGEPDRVYNARGYEQLVYFGKKPGRFWLTGGHVVQVGG
ncbi:MAG: hypothetical protein ABSF37_05865 [Sedimentisphaerales bacterium]|jgi:hypothetical protein